MKSYCKENTAVLWQSILLLLLILFASACSDKPAPQQQGDPYQAKQPQSTSPDDVDKPSAVVEYRLRGVAVKMRKIYQFTAEAKRRLERGSKSTYPAKVIANTAVDLSTQNTPLDYRSWTTQLHDIAQAMANGDTSKKTYQQLVTVCTACHQKYAEKSLNKVLSLELP